MMKAKQKAVPHTHTTSPEGKVLFGLFLVLVLPQHLTFYRKSSLLTGPGLAQSGEEKRANREEQT
jgi:hypothetical protein